MAIGHLVWACVACGGEGTLRPEKKGEVCRRCGTRYVRARGSKILVRRQGSEGQLYTPSELVSMLPEISITGSARCELREWVCDRRIRLFGRYLGRYECLAEARPGTIILDQDNLMFAGADGAGFSIPLLDITAVQPSSSTLQIKARQRPVFTLRFPDSSPRLWEERLQRALGAAYQRAGLGEVVEYQPRVTTGRTTRAKTLSHIRRRIEAARNLTPQRPWQYRLSCWIARNAWNVFGGGVTARGLENIPARGPFLLLANHESYLETMLVPAVMPRACHMMAKSTQFSSRITGWLMARLFAFPVRRFEIDPHAVRYTVRRLSEGYGIVIFIEGERTWDGTLQAGRLGTVRLALAAGVPVIPCRVEGAYDAWPRWASKPQRNRIAISFGRPLQLPETASRADREKSLDRSLELIRDALGPTD